MAEDGLPARDATKPLTVAPVGHGFIPIMNRLQDIFAHLESSFSINLPQVAVVGSQSSGKSSVLEALVGRDFLPRGTDICTRRPLVLQLVRLDSSSASAVEGREEWGEFLHLPGKRLYDFSEIRREIQGPQEFRNCASLVNRCLYPELSPSIPGQISIQSPGWVRRLQETDREAGMRKAISDKRIFLKIFSPNVLNIALVDLPGITKVPVGDQPSDIEARIRTMIMSYIKHETCIILAVSPANADLANSDALQIARNADPDGSRTIGVITKLDIMDRGTDARNFLLGNVIPLRLGYVGIVNRSQEDINANRSIRDALASEEAFFRKHPAYHGLSHCCGVTQLAKKLNWILEQHIMAVLPTLRSHINSQLVAVAKEHATYGEFEESKAGKGVKILNILAKFCEVFSSMVDGKNELSTDELSGGARIHYILQSIFVKCLEEVDPFEDIADEDIRLAIQNASGPRTALFVPEAPFEVLVRRHISRLLDPSLQCAKFIYDELIKISYHCLASELHRYPVLQKRMDEEITNFLREGLQPAEIMISHIIGMEMDYINTSHPNFIGGSKAMELAQQQVKSSRLIPSLPKPKDTADSDKFQAAEKVTKSRGIFSRSVANGAVPDHQQGARPVADSDRPSSSGNTSGSIWAISSIFGASEDRAPAKESAINKSNDAPLQTWDLSFSMIQLREPPLTLKPSENPTEQEALEIAITKLLLKSYFDIVRKNVEDWVPKAIMHFLVTDSSHGNGNNLLRSSVRRAMMVNHTKRELHNVLIRKLYRENMFDEMLKEPDSVTAERKRLHERLKVLQQARKTLEELPFEAETAKGYTADRNPTDLPKTRVIPSSFYATNNYLGSLHTATPPNPRF